MMINLGHMKDVYQHQIGILKGRQGRLGRTHLASPATAAASAIKREKSQMLGVINE
ncbi:MAG: hypothetical protein CM15mP93_12750 [Thiotrichaceae bacterium]|nr:MAG: hypothetical protein CM15mP93_12750 [Thiotrichaceae bacterium]